MHSEMNYKAQIKNLAKLFTVYKKNPDFISDKRKGQHPYPFSTTGAEHP